MTSLLIKIPVKNRRNPKTDKNAKKKNIQILFCHILFKTILVFKGRKRGRFHSLHRGWDASWVLSGP